MIETFDCWRQFFSKVEMFKGERTEKEESEMGEANRVLTESNFCDLTLSPSRSRALFITFALQFENFCLIQIGKQIRKVTQLSHSRSTLLSVPRLLLSIP